VQFQVEQQLVLVFYLVEIIILVAAVAVESTKAALVVLVGLAVAVKAATLQPLA
jgi:hypothetical protein